MSDNKEAEAPEEESGLMEEIRKVKEQVYRERKSKSAEQLQLEDSERVQELANMLNESITVVNPTTKEVTIIKPQGTPVQAD